MKPNVPQSEKDAWIKSGKLEHMTIDGKTMYYNDVAGCGVGLDFL